MDNPTTQPNNMQPGQWSDSQWTRVQQVVHDEAHKSRVAARFLPLCGPLDADVVTIPAETLWVAENNEITGPAERRLAVDDHSVLRLVTISANIALSTAQFAQPELGSALTMFRRAANIIARVEDCLIFGGQPGSDKSPTEATGLDPVFKVSGGQQSPGLFKAAPVLTGVSLGSGQGLVAAVAKAVGYLEDAGHVGPYALALGADLFVLAETPEEHSMVLPSDRIRPIIEGPIVRAGMLPRDAAVLVSLAGSLVEIVVASDINVRFLQVSVEPKYIFRISERVVLRVKAASSMVAFSGGSKAA